VPRYLLEIVPLDAVLYGGAFRIERARDHLLNALARMLSRVGLQ